MVYIGDKKMNKAICIRDYNGSGYKRNNENSNIKVHIKKGDIIEWDNHGYLWFDNVCFGHMDAYPGQYFKY
jgi:hypothetical protein